MGNDAPMTTTILNGKGYRNELDFNGTKIIQVVTDKGGWSINPMAGQTTATPMPDDLLKVFQLRLDVGGPLVNYAARGSKVEYLGKDTAGGASYQLKLTTKDNLELRVFIDANTYFLKKTISKINANGQEMEVMIDYSDYKKTDSGLFMPYAQQITQPQVTLSITHKKIEVNKPIDPSIFEMPK